MTERYGLVAVSLEEENESGRIVLIGHQAMARNLTKWLIRSSFASANAGLHS